jgi:AcrR family transcriptional regulator
LAQNSTTLTTEQKTAKKTATKEESEDLRVRRTRKLIQQAFRELTVEKGFSTITVQDIADRAMVNRSTFYRHYLDKYDLLEKHLDEVYAISSEEEVMAEKIRLKLDDVPAGLLSLLRHIQKHADFYRVMLGPKGDPFLVDRMRQNTARRFQALLAVDPLQNATNPPPIDLRTHYISYAGIGAFIWWLDHQEECSAEQLARWLGQMSSASAGFTLEEYLQRANTILPTKPSIESMMK